MHKEILDMLHAGVCIVDFDYERYEIVMYWLVYPKHPGEFREQP